MYFFSTRQQIDQKWGTPSPSPSATRTLRRAPARVRQLRLRIADPKLFHTEISGTRESHTVAEVDGQLRGLVLGKNISNAIASSGLPFRDLAANQIAFANAPGARTATGLCQDRAVARSHDGAKRLVA